MSDVKGGVKDGGRNARTSGPLLWSRGLLPELRVRAWNTGSNRLGGRNHTAHDGVEVTWISSGSATYQIGRREFVVPTGGSIVIPADVEHATQVAPNTVAVALWIDPKHSAISSAIDDSPLAVCKSEPLCGTPRIAQVMNWLRSEAENSGQIKNCQRAATLLLELLMIEIERSTAALPEELTQPLRCGQVPSRLRHAIDQIEANYAEPLSIDLLAKTAQMSRFHFIRAFKTATGHSPYRYLTLTRLRHAKRLLAIGDRSVTDVALSVGMNDLGRFGRQFRAEFGELPSARLGKAQLSPNV